MSERDFSIGNLNFKLGKLDAFKQFHIVRRVGPILADLLPAMKGMADKQEKQKNKLSESEKLDQFAEIAAPVMLGLSKLSDADSEMVLLGLLSSVEVQQSAGNWAKVANGSMIMMQDLELPVLLQIAGKAFAYKLAGFFAGLPRK